jgi:excisionase family DNA binding protein
MYSTKTALKLLGISKPTLYKLCKQKGIKSKTIGGHYRYSDADLKKLLTSQGVDTRDLETKFVSLVNDVWFVLVEFSNQLWEDGEDKLKKILMKNKENIFIMNISTFKE